MASAASAISDGADMDSKLQQKAENLQQSNYCLQHGLIAEPEYEKVKQKVLVFLQNNTCSKAATQSLKLAKDLLDTKLITKPEYVKVQQHAMSLFMETNTEKVSVKRKFDDASADSQPPKFKRSTKQLKSVSITEGLERRLAKAAAFISSLQTELLKLWDKRKGAEALEKSNGEAEKEYAELKDGLKYWKQTETRLRKQIADVKATKTARIATYDQSRKDQFERPTPKPQHGTFRTSFTCWPGAKRALADGFPTREQIVSDARDYVLGIGNGFGTGKTELVLEGAEATKRKEHSTTVSYISFSNGFTSEVTGETIRNPKKYLGLWLYAAKKSTMFQEDKTGQWNVVAKAELFKKICCDFVNNNWELPKVVDQSWNEPGRVVILDEIQVFGAQELVELVELLVPLKTRMTIIVGALCFSMQPFGSGNRVRDCKFVSPNDIDMTHIFRSRLPSVNTVFEGINLPTLYGGLVRPLVNTTTSNLTDNNNPIVGMQATIEPILSKRKTPKLLVRAVFADVPCMRRKVDNALKNLGNYSIGSLQLKEVQQKTCKFTLAPLLLSSGCIELPDVPDTSSHDQFTKTITHFLNPTWQQFEDLTATAPALRLAALSNTASKLWQELETPALQMVFSSPHSTENAQMLLRKTQMKTNLQVHWYDGGAVHGSVNFDTIKKLVLKDNIVVITMNRVDSPRCPPFDNYLAIPTTKPDGSSGVLLVAIEAKFSKKTNTKYLTVGEIKKKTADVKDWIPSSWSHLLVFATNRSIKHKMTTMLQKDLADEMITCCDHLPNLFSTDLVPLLYREDSYTRT